MGVLLIPVSIVLAVSAAVIFPGLLGRSRLVELLNNFKLKELIGRFGFSNLVSHTQSRILRGAEPEPCPESSTQLDMSILNCRVKLTELKEDNRISDAFNVEVCGSIHAPGDMHYTTLSISILDVTDGVPNAKPVQTRIKQCSDSSGQNPSAFCYKAELGKLPHQVTILSDWTAIAQLRLDWLAFPRKGRRHLQFNTSILSADSGKELAGVRCNYIYDNPAFGYMDFQENIERTKTLAVALAFAVSAADNKLYDCEVELIKNWARDNILENLEQTPDKVRRKLDKALEQTIAFLREGNRLNTYKICKEIVEIAPVAQRYDILDLCLYVAQAKGFVAAEELTILKNLADWLEVDADRFRIMMEKVIPIDMHQVRDVEAILGITSDMSKEIARQHLNKEYSKWNSRVTNSDPGIQTQADQMLKLIAEARSQYIEQAPVLQKDGKMPSR